ncbi:MAG: hypothetical protein JJU46_07865 [Balneolaceae bacterium]|nr:hypothetical protein [Balneolaceae bacterium]MCH8549513.1 hypothetical protein [Balneolaceae bacterium]
MYTIIKSLFPALILILLAFSFTACEDNPVSGEQEHANAVGFVLEMDGDELLRYFARSVSADMDGPFADYFTEDEDGNPVLTLSDEVVDSEGRTAMMTIRWLDSDQNVFDLPPAFQNGSRTDEEWELRLNTSPSDGILGYNIDTEETGWDFQLHAEGEGSANLNVVLWHIDHEDLTQNITVRVDLD